MLDTSSLEEDWFCPRCTCLDNALCVVNEVFESEFTEAAGVFAELDAKDGMLCMFHSCISCGFGRTHTRVSVTGPLAAEPAGDEAPDASSYHSSEDSDFSASASDLSSGSVSSDSSDSDSDSDSVASFGGHSGHSTGSVSAADGTHLLSGASISNDSSSDGEARKVLPHALRIISVVR